MAMGDIMWLERHHISLSVNISIGTIIVGYLYQVGLDYYNREAVGDYYKGTPSPHWWGKNTARISRSHHSVRWPPIPQRKSHI